MNLFLLPYKIMLWYEIKIMQFYSDLFLKTRDIGLVERKMKKNVFCPKHVKTNTIDYLKAHY